MIDSEGGRTRPRPTGQRNRHAMTHATRLLRALAAMTMLTLVMGCGVASAAVGHSFTASLSEAPAGTRLSAPGAVAVDDAEGSVFVADPGTGMVDVYSASGAFVTQFGEGLEASGLAVDEASGEVYVADSEEDAVLVFEPNGSAGYRLIGEWWGSGTPEGGFAEVAGVAVDNSTSSSDARAGDVYVVDAADSAVDVFQPKPSGSEAGAEGSFVGTLSGGKLEEPNGVAVDAATGSVYVADSALGAVDVYSAAGSFESKLTGVDSPQGTFLGKKEETGNVRAIAVEQATGDVYVAETERHVVSQFDASGEWVGWITATPRGPLGEPDGVGLEANGDAYVADAAAHAVDVFGAGVPVPDVATNKASKAGKTSVTLNGVVDGGGKSATYRFEWGVSDTYGSHTSTQTTGTGEEAVAVEVTGLTAGTTYHYHLVGENENGSNVGIDREFTTLPAVAALSTGPVQNIVPTGATLTGSLTPKGTESFYYFQWGTSSSYGHSSPAPPGTNAGSGKEPVDAATQLADLEPNTLYHYRLVGTDQYGSTEGEDEQFTTAGPPRITSQAPSAITQEGATVDAKLNPDELETEYRFQYGETTSYGQETAPAKLAANEALEPVSAALGQLRVGASYHYRLVATNSAGTTYEPDQTLTTVPPALIEDTSAVEVTASGATVQVQINPLGHETSYYVQYGTQPCQPHPEACSDAPAPPGTAIGAGDAAVPVSRQLAGLQPSSTYHYRVLALNSLGTAEGPEQTITVGPAPTPPLALPDDRAWEMVTPPNKGGAPVEALTSEGGWILSAENGDALTYVVDGAQGETAQGNRSPELQQVLATRTSGGWTSQDISTPQERALGVNPGNAPEYQFFSPNLTSALVQPVGAEPPLAPGVKQATPYLRNDSTGTFLPLLTEEDTAPGTSFGGAVSFAGATPDLTHVVLKSGVTLLDGAAPGLYEWTAGEPAPDQLQLVSVLPDKRPETEHKVSLGYDHTQAGAISSDGSRIIWTSEEEEAGLGHLYMHDTVTDDSVQVDAAQGVVEPKGAGTARFQSASADGSRVFFTDRQRLTADSTAEPEPNALARHGEPDLYECAIAEKTPGKPACDLTDLTVDQNEGQHANVQGMLLATSEDGTSVYLIAEGVLATNENGNGETALNGRDNLYELHETDGAWTTTFIATLASEDAPEWEGNALADPAFLTTRVSPNGRYFAFMSEAPITGYDNVDASPAAKGARDEEVYLYDAGTTTLTCVSCDPSGARPNGVLDEVEAGEGLGLVVDRRKVWAGSAHEHWLAGNVPGWTAQSVTGALYQSRYLSSEGRLYFNSPADLVPAATNHKEDVYEYEPSGVGTCQSGSGGCVSLISSGSSEHESAFLEATPTGSDVFFLTEAQLLAQDTDTAFDIYDARECSEVSPCLSPPTGSQAPCAEVQTCRPAQPAQQIAEPAGTFDFTGPATPAHSSTQTPPAKGAVQAKKVVRPLTRAQLLAKALQSCRKRYGAHAKKKRLSCERAARRRYGTARKAGRKAKTGGLRHRRGGHGR